MLAGSKNRVLLWAKPVILLRSVRSGGVKWRVRPPNKGREEQSFVNHRCTDVVEVVTEYLFFHIIS